MAYNIPEAVRQAIMAQSGNPFMGSSSVIFVNNSDTNTGTPNGTWAHPYRTIQAAVDSLPTWPALPFDGTFIWINAGNYDEAVTITKGGSIVMVPLGAVVLGTGLPIGLVGNVWTWPPNNHFRSLTYYPPNPTGLFVSSLTLAPAVGGGIARGWFVSGDIILRVRQGVTPQAGLAGFNATGLLLRGTIDATLSTLTTVPLVVDVRDSDLGTFRDTEYDWSVNLGTTAYNLLLTAVRTEQTGGVRAYGPYGAGLADFKFADCQIDGSLALPYSRFGMVRDTAIRGLSPSAPLRASLLQNSEVWSNVSLGGGIVFTTPAAQQHVGTTFIGCTIGGQPDANPPVPSLAGPGVPQPVASAYVQVDTYSNARLSPRPVAAMLAIQHRETP